MNSLPKTVTRQRRGCDLNPGASNHSATEPPTVIVTLILTSEYTVGSLQCFGHQCFDAVGWAAGRASGL